MPITDSPVSADLACGRRHRGCVERTPGPAGREHPNRVGDRAVARLRHPAPRMLARRAHRPGIADRGRLESLRRRAPVIDAAGSTFGRTAEPRSSVLLRPPRRRINCQPGRYVPGIAQCTVPERTVMRGRRRHRDRTPGLCRRRSESQIDPSGAPWPVTVAVAGDMPDPLRARYCRPVARHVTCRKAALLGKGRQYAT